MTMQFKIKIFYGILLVFLFTACGRDEQIPDVSDIPVNVHIRRFDRDLFSIDTNNVTSDLPRLEANYPTFSPLFFNEILGANDTTVAKNGKIAYIRGFVTNRMIRHLYDTCQVVFRDFRPYEKEFRQAFQFFKYYFPKQSTPDVTTFISEYSIGNFIYGDSNSLAVGLDFFLGEDYPYQVYNPNNENFSYYISRTFTKEHLVAKTLKPLVEYLVGAPSGNRLLDMMIHNGKKLYILDQLLPYTSDSVKWEVTLAQVNWLKDNEREMWAFFLKENLFYSSDYPKIRKYIEYSPNSPGMPDTAPGRTANWLGLQIIKAYMKRYPETTLEQLISRKDAQKILEDSKYKPKR